MFNGQLLLEALYFRRNSSDSKFLFIMFTNAMHVKEKFISLVVSMQLCPDSRPCLSFPLPTTPTLSSHNLMLEMPTECSHAHKKYILFQSSPTGLVTIANFLLDFPFFSQRWSLAWMVLNRIV